ncbi:hypothetical protein KC853_00335 [Candidatus Saccharibacteria bacterium]|nr:hypothetical protein [Candidatus Saccharibacteria bacterium]MCB9834842.1 hypothetical protein [Candidatus Nomurabacteria bacterium]
MQPNYPQPQQSTPAGQPQPAQPFRPPVNQSPRPQMRSVSGIQPIAQGQRRPANIPQPATRVPNSYGMQPQAMSQAPVNQPRPMMPGQPAPQNGPQINPGQPIQPIQTNQATIGNLADKVDNLSSEPEYTVQKSSSNPAKRMLAWLIGVVLSVVLALAAGYYLIFNYLGFPTKDEITQLTDQVKTNAEYIKSLEANIAQFSGNLVGQNTSEYSNSQFKLSFKYPKDYGEVNSLAEYQTVFSFSGNNALSFGSAEADGVDWTVFNFAGIYQDQASYKLALDDSSSSGVTQATEALDLSSPTTIESTNGFTIYQFSAENLTSEQLSSYGLEIKGDVYLVNLPNNSEYSAFVINDQTGSEDIADLLASLKLE